MCFDIFRVDIDQFLQCREGTVAVPLREAGIGEAGGRLLVLRVQTDRLGQLGDRTVVVPGLERLAAGLEMKLRVLALERFERVAHGAGHRVVIWCLARPDELYQVVEPRGPAHPEVVLNRPPPKLSLVGGIGPLAAADGLDRERRGIRVVDPALLRQGVGDLAEDTRRAIGPVELHPVQAGLGLDQECVVPADLESQDLAPDGDRGPGGFPGGIELHGEAVAVDGDRFGADERRRGGCQDGHGGDAVGQTRADLDPEEQQDGDGGRESPGAGRVVERRACAGESRLFLP